MPFYLPTYLGLALYQPKLYLTRMNFKFALPTESWSFAALDRGIEGVRHCMLGGTSHDQTEEKVLQRVGPANKLYFYFYRVLSSPSGTHSRVFERKLTLKFL
jgi:hypothetical protein